MKMIYKKNEDSDMQEYQLKILLEYLQYELNNKTKHITKDELINYINKICELK